MYLAFLDLGGHSHSGRWWWRSLIGKAKTKRGLYALTSPQKQKITQADEAQKPFQKILKRERDEEWKIIAGEEYMRNGVRPQRRHVDKTKEDGRKIWNLCMSCPS